VGHSWEPSGQIIVMPNFYIYEITLNKDKIQDLKLEEKYEFRLGKDSPFRRVNKLLDYDQLTPASVNSLQSVIKNYVAHHEERFIKFINNVGPITIKRHYLEVLPGVGKKLMNKIITERNRKPFETYEELHNRVPGFKPVEVLTKRIIEELENKDVKHRLFVRRPKPNSQRKHRSSGSRRHYKNRRPDYH
jgi:putative nucleotide binding protein